MLLPEGLHTQIKAVEPLAGDASVRRFFRLRTHTGASYVAVSYPLPSNGLHKTHLAMNEYLKKYRIPVPRILGVHEKGSLLVVEDLGEETLEAFYARECPRAARHYYKKAIDLVVTLQGAATDKLRPSDIAYQSILDEKKFMEELEHTHRYFLCGLLGVKPKPAQKRALREGFQALARRAAQQPWVLCHRDYHSRNLLVREKGIGVVDYQDARRGPYTYDLVSLLRDSYTPLTERFRTDMISYFLSRSKNRWNGRPVREDFEYMGLQRNLKALGTFAYQKVERGTGRYLPYIQPTLKQVWLNLHRFEEEFDGLRKALRDCVAKADTSLSAPSRRKARGKKGRPSRAA
jgi:aminoglycoside/choline kinase family phosphotransferase